ncbi:MAG: hypothetical protein ABIF40_05460 [archaeon]
MVDETRADLLKDLTPEELKVTKQKLKKENDKKWLKKIEELEDEDLSDDLIVDEPELEPVIDDDEDVYQEGDVQDRLEDDEIDDIEAGFMEGYDRDVEKTSKKKAEDDEE